MKPTKGTDVTDLLTPREYLISLGLAKAGRGRFSAAGKAAIVKAVAGGMTFKEPEPKAPTRSAAPALSREVKAAKVKPKGAADPKAVREWARANGIAVGERGRIRPEVINGYLDSCTEGGLKVEVPTDSAQDYRPSRRVRPEVMFAVTDLDGKVRKVSYRTACNVCGYSFCGCFCETPKVFSQVEGNLDVLVPAVATAEVAPALRAW